MNFKMMPPDGYAFVPWTVDGVMRLYIVHGLFYADDPRLGGRRGMMYGSSPDFDEEKQPVWKNTWEECLEWCNKHPRS